TSRHLHYNNPVDPTTTLGPMARENLQQQVLDQLKRGELDSQQIRFKYIPKTPPQGYFIAPHIIDARTLHQNNPLLIEEVFGPIAICDSFESTDDAIEKANRTTFGLAASIWSNDPATVNACIKHIECGTVAINKAVHSAFDTPFGGWKQSGIGLELGISGAISFTRFKAIQ
ncbi:MAG: aldehyde dehydrogenase family protein, partial [Candidatus Margulisiibacteriota bacterium]